MDKRKRQSGPGGFNKKLKTDVAKSEPYQPPPLFPKIEVPALPKPDPDEKNLKIYKLHAKFLSKPSPYYLDSNNILDLNLSIGNRSANMWSFLKNSPQNFPPLMVKSILNPKKTNNRTRTNVINETELMYENERNLDLLKKKEQEMNKTKKNINEDDDDEEKDEEEEKEEEVEDDEDEEDFERYNQSDDDMEGGDDDEPIL